MKKMILANALLLCSGLLWARCALHGNSNTDQVAAAADGMPAQQTQTPSADNTRVQVALLLDTSNSMDGLIDQAKSRLWNIVNTLTTLKYNGKTPTIEISLYEYGNSGLSVKDNYIRQVTTLTTDLDLVSEKLFALRTNGGDEYCGAVIAQAVKTLEWGGNTSDMKLIYVAGNEPFNQGKISYKEAVSEAHNKNIYINTIFCGDRLEGINTFWKEGADLGLGKYFNINSDVKVRFIETPYDDQISSYNTRLNDTYIGYGSYGSAKKSSQMQQDKNAETLSKGNSVERYVSKSKSVYKNSSWDLVDQVKADSTVITKIKMEELPKELQGKTKAELKLVVLQMNNQRDSIQKEMAVLAKKRQAYIDAEMKKSNNTDDIGEAIQSSIVTLAKTKGYTVGE